MPMSNNLNALNNNVDEQQSSRVNNLNVLPTEEIQKARDDAMQNYLAGINTTSDVSTPVSTQDTNKVTEEDKNKFLSRYNLIDASTSTPDASKILGLDINEVKAEDKTVADKIKDMYSLAYNQKNTSTENAYAPVKTAGLAFLDTSWWLNLFRQGDYEDYSQNENAVNEANTIIRDAYDDAVTQTTLSSAIAETQAFSALTNLKGLDLDQTGLAFKTVAEMFPSLQALTAVDNDTEFYNALNSGAIETSLRLTQGSDGNYYYLHTDGKMYELGNGTKSGADGSIQLNDDGSYKTIYLGDEALSWATDITSGVTGTFFSLGELVTGAADLIGEIFSSKDDGQLGLGWTNALKAFQNSSTLLSGSRIDATTGDQLEDYLHITANMVGSILGSTILYGDIAGDILGANSYTSWAEAGFGQKVGFLMKAQSGNFGIVEKNLNEATFTMANTWGRRFTQAGLSNVRGLLSDFATGVQQAALYKDGSDELDVFGNAFSNAAINFGIDLLLTGGQDDQQYQQFSSTYAKMTGKVTKDHKLMQDITKYVEGTDAYNEAFASYLSHKRHMIGVNSTMDFVGNMLSGAFNANFGVTNGKVQSVDLLTDDGRDRFTSSLMNWGNALRSGINTWQYSLKGQINDINVGMASITEIHTKVYNELNNKIATAKTPEQKQALIQIQNEYMEDVKSGSQDSSNYELGVYKAISNLNNKIADEKNVLHPLIKDAIDTVTTKNKAEYAKEFFMTSKATYDYFQAKRQQATGAGKIFQQLNDYLNDPSASNTIEKVFKKVSRVYAMPHPSDSPYATETKTFDEFKQEYNSDAELKTRVDKLLTDYQIKGTNDERLRWAFDNEVVTSATPSSKEQIKFMYTFSIYQQEIRDRAELAKEIDELPESSNLMIVAGFSSIPESEDGKRGLKEEIAEKFPNQYLDDYTFIYIPNQSNKDDIEDPLEYAWSWMKDLGVLKEITGCAHARGSVFYYKTNDASKFNTLCLNQDINTTLRLIPYIVQKSENAQDITQRIEKLDKIFRLTKGLDKKKFMSQIINSAYDKMSKLDVLKFATYYHLDDGKIGSLTKVVNSFIKNEGRGLDLNDSNVVTTLNQLADEGRISKDDVSKLLTAYSKDPESFSTGSALNNLGDELASSEGNFKAANDEYKELDTLVNKIAVDLLKGTDNIIPSKPVINLSLLVGKNMQAVANITIASNTHEPDQDTIKTYGDAVAREEEFIKNEIANNFGPMLEATPDNIARIEKGLDIKLNTSVTVIKDLHTNDIETNKTIIKTKNDEVNMIDYLVPIDPITLKPLSNDVETAKKIALVNKMNRTRIEKTNVDFQLENVPQIGQYIFVTYDEKTKSYSVVKNPLSEATGIKSGKVSKKGSEVEMLCTMLDEQFYGKQNRKLATYFIVKRYLTNILELPADYRSIPITQDEANKIKFTNPFWRVKDFDNGNLYAEFKPETTEKIESLLKSKHTSIYDAFPFNFEYNEDAPESYFGAYKSYITEGLKASTNKQYKTAFDAFDRVPWSKTGEYEGEFFQALIDGKFEDGTILTKNFLSYNSNKMKSFGSWRKYKAHLATTDNPEELLIKNYVESFNKIYNKDSDGSGNYTILLRTSTLQPLLLNMVGREDYDVMAKQLQEAYNDPQKAIELMKANNGGTGLSVDSIQAATGNAFRIPLDQQHLVFTGDNVKKALSNLNLDYNYEYGWDVKGKAKLLSLIAESDGYVALKDVKEIKDIIDNNKEARQTFIDLFGDNAIEEINKRSEKYDEYFTGTKKIKRNVSNNNSATYTDQDTQLVQVDTTGYFSKLKTHLEKLKNVIDKAEKSAKKLETKIGNGGYTNNEIEKTNLDDHDELMGSIEYDDIKTFAQSIQKDVEDLWYKTIEEFGEEFELADDIVDWMRYDTYDTDEDQLKQRNFEHGEQLEYSLVHYKRVNQKLYEKIELMDKELTANQIREYFFPKMSDETFNKYAPEGTIKPVDLMKAMLNSKEEFINRKEGQYESLVKTGEAVEERRYDPFIRDLKDDVIAGLEKVQMNKELKYQINNECEAQLNSLKKKLRKLIYSYSTSVQPELDHRADVLNVVRYVAVTKNTLATLEDKFESINKGDTSEIKYDKLEEAARIISAVHSVKTINDKDEQFYVFKSDGTLRTDLIADSEESLYIELSKDPEYFKKCTIISASFKDNNEWQDISAIKMKSIDLSDTKVFDEVAKNLYIKELYAAIRYGKFNDEEFKLALKGELGEDKVLEALSKVPIESVSTLAKRRKLWKDKASLMDYEEFAYEFEKNANEYLTLKNTLDDAIKLYYGEDIGEQKANIVYTLAMQIGDPDVMSADKRNLIHDVVDEAVSVARLNGHDDVADIIEKIFVDGDAAAIDYIVRNRNLAKIIEEYDAPIKDDDVKFYPVTNMNKGEVDEIVEKIKSGDLSNVLVFDLETGFNDMKDKAFQIGFNGKNYFICPDNNPVFKEKSKEGHKARLDYAKKVNMLDNEYFRDEPGYKEAVLNFINGDGEFKTVSEIRKIFEDNKDKILIGYNSEAFDIPILNRLFGVNVIKNQKQIDVLKLLLNSGNAQQSTYKLNPDDDPSLEGMGAHGAGADTMRTLDVLKTATDGYKSINKIKNSLTESFKNEDGSYKTINIDRDKSITINDDIIKSIDEVFKMARGKYQAESLALFGDIDLNVERITDLRSVVRLAENTALNNALYLVRDKNDEAQYFMTDNGKVALDQNSFINIDKAYSFCMNHASNEKSQDYIKGNFIWEFAKFVKDTKGTVSLNNILETAADEEQVKNFIATYSNFVNVKKEEIDLNNPGQGSYKAVEANVNGEKYSGYESFHTAARVHYAFNQVMDQLSEYLPDGEEDFILAEMQKVLSTPNGEKIDLGETSLTYVNDRLAEAEYRYLKDHAGTVDGIVSQKEKGSYSLIGASEYGDHIKDAITGKGVDIDASCVVISRTMARELGIDLKHKRSNSLYSFLMAQPGDNNQKMIPVRIVVDDSYTNRQGKEILVSEVTAMMLSRDFDGDHAVLLKPRSGNQDALAHWCSNMYGAENFQAMVLKNLRNNYKTNNKTLEFRTNADVTKLCREIDKYLEAGNDKEAEKLNDELGKITSEEFKNEFGLKRSKTTHQYYVANPEAWRDNNGEISYSAKIKNQEVAKSYQIHKKDFAPIDSITGYNAKSLINSIQDKKFKTMRDFVTYGTYITDVVEDAIDNVDDLNTIKNVISTAAELSGYKDIYDELKSDIDKADNKEDLKLLVNYLIKEGEANKTYLSNEKSLENRLFMRALKSNIKENKLIDDEKFKLLTKKVERLNLLNSKLEKSFTGGDPGRKFSTNIEFTLDKLLDKYDDDIQVADLLKKNDNDYKVFIIDTIEGKGKKDYAHPDMIMYNTNTNKRVYTKEYHAYKANDYQFEGKLDEWNDKPYQLNSKDGKNVDVNIVRRYGDRYVTGSVHELNGNQKVATGVAGKGSLRFTGFNSDQEIGTTSDGKKIHGSDIQFAVFGKDSKFAAPRTLDGAQKVSITQEDGTKLTGYLVDTSVVVTENDDAWAGIRDRMIDLLQVISNANTISAFELGLLDYDEDTGEISTNISKYKKEIARLKSTRSNAQYTNYLPLLNRIKYGMVINAMSDEQIAKQFGGTYKKEDVLRMINNKDIASVDFGEAVENLAEEYVPELLNHPAFKKDWLSMVADSRQTYQLGKQSGDENQRRFKTKGKGIWQSKSNKDVDINALKEYNNADHTNDEYETTEDGFLSVYQFLRLFNQSISKDQIRNAYKNDILLLGSYVPNTNSIENGFRGMDTRFSHRKTGRDHSKTSGTLTKSNEDAVVGTSKPLVFGGHKFIYNDNNSINWQTVLSEDVKSKNNWIKTYDQDTYGDVILMHFLHKFEEITPGMSYEEKFDKLTRDHKYSIMNNFMDIVINDKGKLVNRYNPGEIIEGSSSKVQRKLKSTTYNYSAMKALKGGEQGPTAGEDFTKEIIKGTNKEEIKNNEETMREAWKAIKEEFLKTSDKELAQQKFMDSYLPKDCVAQDVLFANKAKSVMNTGHRWFDKICSWFSRTGINEYTEGGAQQSAAAKAFKSNTRYVMVTLENKLNNVVDVFNNSLPKDIQKEFVTLNCLVSSLKSVGTIQKDNEAIKIELQRAGFDTYEQAEQRLEQLRTVYREAATALDEFNNELILHVQRCEQITREPFGSRLIGLMSPYVRTISDDDKKANKAKARTVLQTLIGVKGLRDSGKVDTSFNYEYDFVNSAKQIINYVAQTESLEYISSDLKHRRVLSNSTLYEAVNTAINNTLEEVISKGGIEFAGMVDKTKVNRNLIKQIQVYSHEMFTGNKISFSSLVGYYQTIDAKLDRIVKEYHINYPQQTKDGYTNMVSLSREHIGNPQFDSQGQTEKTIANLYFSKMLLGQILIESNSDFANKISENMEKFVKDSGYVLTNEWGQKITEKNFSSSISPLSLMNLREEIEIAINNGDKEKWNQYLFGKILCGELYLCEKESADNLEEYVYTYKVPNQFQQLLQKVSKWSASLIMSNPIKMPSRFTRFTLEDYGFLTAYTGNPITAAIYANKARKQLYSAFKSNGNTMTPELEQYMRREGQPIKSGIVASDVGVVDYSGSKNKVSDFLEKLSSPLEYQNHLGRYAIYLAALDSFNGSGMKGPVFKKPNYGAAYFAKQGIDKMETNEDKAMMVMDYMIGSPGGFPKISSNISGYFMYTTFPLNFVRTAGSYAISVAKAFEDAASEDKNTNGALTSLISPVTGVASITAGYWLLAWIVGHLYGLSDEEIKELQGNFGSLDMFDTVDIVNTIASGTPVKSSDSSNPAGTFIDTFITPVTDAQERYDYQTSQGNSDTMAGELVQSYSAKVFSKLNPLLKNTAEVVLQHDIYDTSYVDTSNLYTRTENAIRKGLGNVFGSEMGTALMDQYKADMYDDDTTFLNTVATGIGNGIAKQFNYKKADKNGATNYYEMITTVRNAYSQQSGAQQLDVDDIDGDVDEYASNQNWNYDDYQRVRTQIKKMMQLGKDSNTVYEYLTNEYQNNNVSAYTLKSVINSVSLKRAIDKLPDPDAFYSSLTPEQYSKLQQALEYEEQIYPDLEDKFKSVSSSSSGYSSNYSSNYGSTNNYSSNYYSASTPYFHSIYASSPYFKSIYYNNYYNKKYKNNNNKKRVVQVDKNMGLGRYGVQDFKPNLYYKNNPIYNNLSDYQKQKKVGER